ncbi:hypothetical protein [Endozoicomonas sp. Mp262]|uniref:hypothetical protein n=1 Tax=Endozoicomonas sp. Mp262 TaxID=2919499 RepID=UPI0021D9FC3D
MNKIKVFLITLVTLTLSISLAQAGQWQWEKLGERAVTHKITKGEINIGLGDGRYDALPAIPANQIPAGTFSVN